jgi:hypothetical protein
MYKLIETFIQKNITSKEEYYRIKEEIINHITGDLPYDHLSKKSKEILIQWEEFGAYELMD